MDRTMLRIGAMDMMTHGAVSPHLEYRDSLSVLNVDAGYFSPIFKIFARIKEGIVKGIGELERMI